jgi:hypothetical protein
VLVGSSYRHLQTTIALRKDVRLAVLAGVPLGYLINL